MTLPYQNITDVLERMGATQPATTALHVPGRKSLTFGQLEEQVRYVREQLTNWGVSHGNVVAGVIPGRPEMAAACAALPSSATFAPLGPNLTTEEYTQLLIRLRACAVLVPKDYADCARMAARSIGVSEIEMTTDPQGPAGLFTMRLCGNGRPPQKTSGIRPDVAYILTSSGTTGQRKLVPSTHRQTLLYARAASNWLKYSSQDLNCHLMPLHSGNGLRGLINPLLAGVPQLCLPETDVEGFFKALDDYPVTCLNAGFAFHRAILRSIPAHPELIRQSRFRFLRAGTGSLRREEIDRLEQAFGAPALVSLSSVETPISHDPLPPRCRKPGAAGLAFVNDLAIISHSGVLPVNSTGEIVVHGPLVFRGYLDDPELTAASFVNGWFRTGDLGYVDEDGYVHVCGRLKEIINRGGEKISPAEIDFTMESLPEIKEAAAFGVPHPTLGEEVVAAAVREGAPKIDEPQLIDLIRKRIGPTKAPRKIYFVDQLPRNANGKVLRTKLTEMFASGRNAAASSLSPVRLTPLETSVAELWASVLETGNFRADDNFFLIGGDSLQAAQLITRIKASFGVELAVESLSSEAWTVSGMARAIDRIRQDSDVERNTRSSAGELAAAIQSLKRPFFFSHGDLSGSGLLLVKLAHHLGSDRPLHPLPPAGLDGKAFPASIQEMAQRHIETIRSVQKQGPYLLGGYCNGGLVAFETARQLQHLGEKIDAIILIEVSARGKRRQHQLISCAARLLRLNIEQELECYIRLYALLTASEKRFYGLNSHLLKRLGKLKVAAEWLGWVLTQRYRSSGTNPTFTLDTIDFASLSLDLKIALQRRIMSGYVPNRYKGVITVFRCKEGQKQTTDPTMGWGDVATEVDLHEIPGDHVTCLSMNEHVGALALEIRSCWERIQLNDHIYGRSPETNGR